MQTQINDPVDTDQAAHEREWMRKHWNWTNKSDYSSIFRTSEYARFGMDCDEVLRGERSAYDGAEIDFRP